MNSVFLIGIPSGTEWAYILAVELLSLICVVDIIRSEFRRFGVKPMWCVAVVFFPIFGPLLYYWFGLDQKAVSRGQ